MSVLPPVPDVVGTVLDGTAPYIIDPVRDAVLRHTTGASPAKDNIAHPAWYYIAAQAAMGLTVAELCATCDFDVERGPLMVESSVEFRSPLKTGHSYCVVGEITGLTRRQSRKLGTIDLLDYRLDLVDAEGVVVLVNYNSWMLPRGAEA